MFNLFWLTDVVNVQLLQEDGVDDIRETSKPEDGDEH